MPDADVAISVVLPAYNEARRLPPYLELVRTYLEGRFPERYEVIVVDDGSTDGLDRVLERLAAGWPRLRSVRHPVNRGKGAAVRTGVLAARGDLVLFADADGATPIEEEERLAEAIRAGADVAVGSRLLDRDPARCARRWYRGLAGRLFAALARRLLGLTVRDTQCGFKMFRREAARQVFEQVRESGYLFDLEVLALAARLGLGVAEVPIRWTEVPGGRFRPARELPRILVELVRLRRRLRSRRG